MKFALAHFRIGYTDGVSLEMDKWKKALEALGHEVIYIAGQGQNEAFIKIEDLNISSEQHRLLFHHCYESLDDYDEKTLKDDIESIAKRIEDQLVKVIVKERIDYLIPNNILSLGLNIPSALGFKNAIIKTGVKVINHHHDFYWERERYSKPTTKDVKTYLDQLFPFHHEQVKHCVINKIAQNELYERKHIQSTIIPNVFDFTREKFNLDHFNNDLKDKLGIKPNDIVFLQATRIEDRKAIELTIDVLEEVYQQLKHYVSKQLYNKHIIDADTKIHLIIAGMQELRADKMANLMNKINHASYDIKLINSMIGSKRMDNENKTYALWDTYAIADFITYPSILEGWGNQFLEGVFAEKPIMIYEYPVYLTDIKPYGFKTISLGHQHDVDENGLVRVSKDIVKQAANDILTVLTDDKLYKQMVDENFKIGSKYFSINSLQNHLKNIIDNKKYDI